MEIKAIILTLIVAFSWISYLRYIVYLLIAPFYTIKQCSYHKISQPLLKSKIERSLKVSVIIPAWNEGVGIISSIRSLLNNTYKNIEIIVVNDGSQDDTESIIKQFMRKELPLIYRIKNKFKYLCHKQNQGKGKALNSGIKHSTGDIIITVDGDTKLHKNAIENIVRHFIDPSVEAVVGNVKIANSKTMLGLLQQIEYTLVFYFKRVHSVMDSIFIVGGAFGAFRRNVFNRFGYFDECSKTEDIEFSTRLKWHGCKIVFAEDAIAYTEGPSTFMGLIKQRLRWKKGLIDTFIKYHDIFFSFNRKHNIFLSWVLLPYSLFGDIQLIFELILLPCILYYTIIYRLYYLWFGWTFFLVFTLIIIYLFGSKKNNRSNLLLSPLYYVLSLILFASEIYAIIGTIKLHIMNKDIVWQNWNRRGVEHV